MMRAIAGMFLGVDNIEPIRTVNVRQRIGNDAQKKWIKKYNAQNEKMQVSQLQFERDNKLVTGSISTWKCKHKL